MIGIHAASYYLPAEVRTVSSWCAEQSWDEHNEKALLDSGALNYHFAGQESMASMGANAVRQLLADNQVQGSEVDALVFFHTSQTNVLPPPESITARVRALSGLSNALVFSISQQNCVSTLHGLRVLKALFAAHPQWRQVVLLGIDIILDERLRAIGVSGIQSDAASAMLIRARDYRGQVIAIETFNDPKLVKGIHADGRYEENNNYLWSAISVIRRTLKAAGIQPQDLQSILPHNANYPAWQQILGSLRLPEEKLFSENIFKVGHAFGSDCAINMIDRGALSEPGYHMVFSSGIGGCFGAMVMHCKGEA